MAALALSGCQNCSSSQQVIPVRLGLWVGETPEYRMCFYVNEDGSETIPNEACNFYSFEMQGEDNAGVDQDGNECGFGFGYEEPVPIVGDSFAVEGYTPPGSSDEFSFNGIFDGESAFGTTTRVDGQSRCDIEWTAARIEDGAGGSGGMGGAGGTTPATAFTDPCPADGQLPAIADAFIRGDGFSDTPYGEEQRLAIKSVINQSFTRKIYIAFDVSPVNPGFEKAYLVLSLRRHIGDVNPATEPGPQPVDVFGITDDMDWDPAELAEGAITWNNAPRNVTAMPSEPQFEQSDEVPLLIAAYDFDVPPRGVVDLGTESVPTGDTRYALDITDYVKERLDNDADGKITVLMAAYNPMNINQEGSDFWSLQAPDECNRPFLHFE